MKKIERLLKYAEGGEIRKLDTGGYIPGSYFAGEYESEVSKANFNGNLSDYILAKQLEIKKQSGVELTPEEQLQFANLGKTYSFAAPQPTQSTQLAQETINSSAILEPSNTTETQNQELLLESRTLETPTRIPIPGVDKPEPINAGDVLKTGMDKLKLQLPLPKTKISGSINLPASATQGISLAANIGAQAINAVDQATMGDKNFSASSQAIDSVVHGASGALMKSGNPYAMIAGVALEGLNWITKAGGKTVQGYDVNINNSGYGTMGHMESESGRFWQNMNGKLAKRNEQARMALAASEISEDQAFEQEARTNSVTNVLQQNQIALAGGIDTSLLGS